MTKFGLIFRILFNRPIDGRTLGKHAKFSERCYIEIGGIRYVFDNAYTDNYVGWYKP